MLEIQWALAQMGADMGCGTPGPGGPDTHKVFGRNFTMGGHPQKVAVKVSGYGNFRWFTYMNLYPCKMLTFWYKLYDGMTYMYKYMSASACACIDFSLLSLNPYIVKNQCVYNWTYICCYCKWVHRLSHLYKPTRTSRLTLCIYVLYLYSKGINQVGPNAGRAKPGRTRAELF